MNDLLPRTITALILAVTGLVVYCVLPERYFVAVLGLVLLYILCVEWPRFNVWWLTPWYPVVPFLALTHLYATDSYLWLWVVITVVAYDTGGYIFGNLFGTWHIAPHLSAGKTMQGLIGGVVSAAFVSMPVGYFLQKSLYFGILYLLVAGTLVGILAFCGDLFESYLKRRVGIKDSGYLLPGHGGVLDRIDGLLWATLIVDIVLNMVR